MEYYFRNNTALAHNLEHKNSVKKEALQQAINYFTWRGKVCWGHM